MPALSAFLPQGSATVMGQRETSLFLRCAGVFGGETDHHCVPRARTAQTRTSATVFCFPE